MAGVSGRGALCLVCVAVLPIVIMQTAKLYFPLAEHANQVKHIDFPALINSRSVHTGIDVEENADSAPGPLLSLHFILGQDGDPHLREAVCSFAYAPCIGPQNGVGDQNIGCATFACSK